MLDLTLRELKIVQLQLQSSNVIHYCLNYHMHHQHCLSWGQKRVPTSGSFTTGCHVLSCHIRCHPKTSIPSICCICKTQRASCCCMAAIRSGLTRSATFSTSNVSLLSVLSSTCFQDQRCIDIILIAPKYILQIEHTRFFKSTLTTWLNASCGIPRGYFLRTHVGIRPLMGIVWCNNSYWLVLSDLVHINPLSRLRGIGCEGGRNISFTTFLHDILNSL